MAKQFLSTHVRDTTTKKKRNEPTHEKDGCDSTAHVYSDLSPREKEVMESFEQRVAALEPRIAALEKHLNLGEWHSGTAGASPAPTHATQDTPAGASQVCQQIYPWEKELLERFGPRIAALEKHLNMGEWQASASPAPTHAAQDIPAGASQVFARTSTRDILF